MQSHYTPNPTLKQVYAQLLEWYSLRITKEKQKGNTKAVEHLENDLKRLNITR